MSKITTLMKVNGVDYTAQILTPFTFGRPKLWSGDTGRVMSGDMQGSMIGIFPKLSVVFAPKTEDELASLCQILDSAWQNVSVYDPTRKGMTSLGTYTNDYEVTIKNLDPLYGDIKVSFISTKAV